MINKTDYVDLGLVCADVCRVLDEGIKRRRADELSRSVFEAIRRLNRWVESVIHMPADPLTKFPIAGLWPRSRIILSSGVNEMGSLG